MNPTRAEIDFAKLSHNLNSIRKHLHKHSPKKRIKVCGVVKANAYGHGLERISEKLVDLGVDYLGVANYDEAIKLRRLIPKAPILVFGTLIHSKLQPERYVSILAKNNLIATVASLDTARFLDYYNRKSKKKFKIHIKVDTGMKRIGFDVKRAFKNIQQIFAMKNLFVEGIFTHFATAESKNKFFAHYQLSKFIDLLDELKKCGYHIPVVHSANSAAVLDVPESYFDMVRPGLILYGYYPSNEVKNKIDIVPVMNFKSKVTFIKKVDAKTSISYGRLFYTKNSCFIGSVPIGYGDGYWRMLTNKSRVYINKKLYRTIGAITMDWLMVDLGIKSKVHVGDDVLLMGQENGKRMGADKLARLVGGIPYEMLCSVADRVNRIYLNE